MNKYIEYIKNLANNSKYTKIYINLCESRSNHPKVKNQTERHHILPKSFAMGGEKDILNLVNFTAKEHFIAHYLLTKMFDDKKLKAKMLKAITKFWQSNSGQSRKLNSRQYSILRKCAAEANKIINTGSKRTEKTKKLMSENSASGLQSTKDAIAKTKLEKYGISGYSNPQQMKKTKLIKYGSESFVNPEKAKQTNLEKYGFESPMQNENFKEQYLENQRSRYNGDLWYQSDEFKNKSKQTCLEKYGVEHPAQIPEVIERRSTTLKNKSKNEKQEIRNTVESTNLEKHGCKIPANKPIVCEFCNHKTILQWYNRKHKNGMCLKQP